jgi:transposase
MRYAQRGGYTPAEQQRRKRLRLEAAGRFARGDGIGEIARDLRVTEGSVRRWHRAWRDGGDEALRPRGPVSRERLSPQQWARLELELRKGPLTHGFAGDQRWTLGRIKTLIGSLAADFRKRTPAPRSGSARSHRTTAAPFHVLRKNGAEHDAASDDDPGHGKIKRVK